jgi:hypothetical protein
MYLLLLALAIAAVPEFEAESLQGQPVAGRLIALDAKQVTLEGPAGRVSLPLEKVAALTAKTAPGAKKRPADERGAMEVRLTDGSAVAAKQYAVRAGRAAITLSGGEVLELPAGEVASARLQPGTAATEAQWSRIADMKPQSDVLVVVKGENLDYHKGVIQDVNNTHVRFEFDGEPIAVKRPKVYGLFYYHAAGEQLAESRFTVFDSGGSRWAAQSLAVAEGRLQWTAPGGRSVSRQLEQVERIDLTRGKVAYLSDLEPDRVAYTPFFAADKALPSRLAFFAPRKDQTLEAKPIRIGGRSFTKGLSLHCKTEIAYTLPNSFSRFQAVAGIDDEVRPRGHLRLAIYAGDKLLLQTAISGADAPKPIDLDISGVRRLVIMVDFGSDVDIAGHLDLGDARLIK